MLSYQYNLSNTICAAPSCHTFMRLIVMSRARTSRAKADHLTKVVNTEQNLLMVARGAINQPIARKLSCIYTRLFLFTFQRQLGIVLVIGIEISDVVKFSKPKIFV